MHKLSKGNLAIAQRLFVTAQLKVIGTGNEVITPALLGLSESVLTSRADEFIQQMLSFMARNCQNYQNLKRQYYLRRITAKAFSKAVKSGKNRSDGCINHSQSQPI